MVNIVGIPKEKVLAALYNASSPMGLGFLNYDAEPMSEEKANELLLRTNSFDYINGRVMKIKLDNDMQFDESLYDRDNGAGAAQRAIDNISN